MCDYSLEAFGSRPARKFERYMTTRFPSGSIGLASPGDASCAVCVQYDTRIAVDALPKEAQLHLELGSVAEATFVRLEHGPYRDGLRFDNGRKLSLQQLGPGVSMIVTRLVEEPAPVRHLAAAV
jgi:hypothetical protein